MSLLLLIGTVIFAVSRVDANSCLFIPAGSVMKIDLKNQTLGETVCNYCSYSSSGKDAPMTSNIYSCDESARTAQFKEYEGDSCTGTATNTYDIVLANGNFTHDMCIGYKDVMYTYDTNNPQNCKGEIMSNVTLFGKWGPLNECFIANSVDVITEYCINDQPLCKIWHPPDFKCTGPDEANITYNDCTPPYDGHTEQLTLLVNPCAP